jgi:hypothetical protein
MKVSVLAEDLRNRQRARAKTDGGVFAEAVAVMDRLSDMAIVECYTTCSCCGEKYPSGVLKQLVESADCVEEFFEIADQISTKGELLSRPQPQNFPFSRSKAICISTLESE